MSQPRVFKCPMCGGSNSISGEEDHIPCQFCGNSIVVPESLRVKKPAPPPPPVPPYVPVQMPPVIVTTTSTDAPSRRGLVTWFVALIVLFVVCPTIFGIGFAVLGTGAGIAAFLPFMGELEGLTTQVPGLVSTAAPQATPSFATVTLTFGGEGTGAGRFDDPRAIVVDTQGNVYIGEYTTGRVQKFDANGQYLTTWTPEGENPLLTLTADTQGNVYAVRQGWIIKSNSQAGEPLAKFTLDGYIESAVTLPNGTLLAYQRSRTDELVFLDSRGQELNRVPEFLSAVDDDTATNLDIAVDGQGNIFVLSQRHSSVFRYSPDGRFLDRFGSDGDSPGQFTAPGAIAVDSRGRIYVSDFKGIQVFSPDGTYLDVFDVPTGGINGLAFSVNDVLYVASNSNEIYRFELSD